MMNNMKPNLEYKGVFIMPRKTLEELNIATDMNQVLLCNAKKHNVFNVNPFVLPLFTKSLTFRSGKKNAFDKVLMDTKEVTADDFLLMSQIYGMLGAFHLNAYNLLVKQFKESDTRNIQDYLFDQINVDLLQGTTNAMGMQETLVQRLLRVQVARVLDSMKINGNRVAQKDLAKECAIKGIIDFMNYDNGKYTPMDYGILYFIQGILKQTNCKAKTMQFTIEPYQLDLLRFLKGNTHAVENFHTNFAENAKLLRDTAINYTLDGHLKNIKVDVAAFEKAKTLSDLFDAIIKPAEEEEQAKANEMAQQIIDEQQDKYDQLPTVDFFKDFLTTPVSSHLLRLRAKAAQQMMEILNDNQGFSDQKFTISSDVLYHIMSTELQKAKDGSEQQYIAGQMSDIQMSIDAYFQTLYNNYSEPDKNNLIQFISSKSYNTGRFGNHIIELGKGATVNTDYQYLGKNDYLSKYSSLYYTVNTFKNYGNKSRTVNNVGGVNAFYLDLDIVKNLKPQYKKQFMVRNMADSEANSAFVYHLTRNFLDVISKATKFPTPTMVLFTGHGLQLVWSFNNPLIIKTDGFRKQLMNLLKKLADYVRDQLIISVHRNVPGVRELKKVFGDRTEDIVKTLDTSVYDMARLLRMPLTYNDKGKDDYHQDFAFPFAASLPYNSKFQSLLDLMDYLDIKNYSQQFAKGKTTRKKKATLSHSQKMEMIERNHTNFDQPISAEKDLYDKENDKPKLDIQLLLSHSAIKGFEPIKQLTQSHLTASDAKSLATATHRMNFTCTRTIEDGQFVLLGKIDPANVKLNVLGQTIHTVKQFAADMKGLYKYAFMHNKKVPNIFGTVSDNSAKSVLVNYDSVQKVFSQTYYAQTNLVRLINALPNVVKYWNASQAHYRNNTLLLVSNLAAGLEQYRLVLPNVSKLNALINDGIDKHFDEIADILEETKNENIERQNAWEQFVRQINSTVFKDINTTDPETGEQVASLDEDELQGIFKSYNYIERSTMALSRATFARKVGLVQGQTDEWFVARGLSAFLNPYTNTYRNPMNKLNFKSGNVISLDGVKFEKTLVNEIKNAKTEGYYEGLSDEQIQQKIIYQLMVPFLYAQPQNDVYARQIENLIKKEQEKQYAISVFMSNEVLNYKLHDEMNAVDFAEKVHHMSRGSYYRNLKLIGGKEAVKEAYEQLKSFVNQIDDEDIRQDELADFKQQQLVGATQHADVDNVDNVLTVDHSNELLDDNVAVIAELMRNVDFKKFVTQHNWNIKDLQSINEYMNDYLSHIYLATKMNNTSLQRQHYMWLADHYDLFNYLYNLKQANKDGINYLIQKDLNNPKINQEMKNKIKSIADGLKQQAQDVNAMQSVDANLVAE